MIKKITDVETLERIVDLQSIIWGFSYRDCIPSHVLLICKKLGGFVLGNYADGELTGFCATFVGVDHKKDIYHYLHALGVSPSSQSKNVGFNLMKHHQKLSLSLGINRIKWTFDPLESRNANLYLNKLGAVVESYASNYYGTLENDKTQIESDRFFVSWEINNTEIDSQLPSFEQIQKDYTVIDVTLVNDFTPSENQVYAIEIPSNFQLLSNQNIAEANKIRMNSRLIFLSLIEIKKKINGFVRVKEEYNYRCFYVTG